MQRLLASRPVRTVGASILALAGLVSAAQGVRNALAPKGSQDFQWDAAWVLLRRMSPYHFNLAGIPSPTDVFTPGAMEANQVPSALMLLWPYAFTGWTTAKTLWVFSNLLFTIGVLYLTFRLFVPNRSRSTYIAVAGLFCASLPWRDLVGLGQHLLFSFFFFLLAVWYAERRRELLAGVLLALSFFKYTTIFALLPYFLYKRWYRPLVVAFGLHGVATLFAAVWLRESPVELVLQSLRISATLTDKGFVDLFAVTTRLGLGDSKLLPWMLSATLLTVGVIGCLRRRADPVRVLSVLALLSTVVVYHRDYDLIVLLVPLVAVLFGHERDRVLGALFLGAIGMSWYVDKVMYTLYPTPQDPRLPPFLAPYYWAEVVVWYATLFYGLWLLHRPERVPEPAPAR